VLERCSRTFRPFSLTVARRARTFCGAIAPPWIRLSQLKPQKFQQHQPASRGTHSRFVFEAVTEHSAYDFPQPPGAVFPSLGPESSLPRIFWWKIYGSLETVVRGSRGAARFNESIQFESPLDRRFLFSWPDTTDVCDVKEASNLALIRRNEPRELDSDVEPFCCHSKVLEQIRQLVEICVDHGQTSPARWPSWSLIVQTRSLPGRALDTSGRSTGKF
jgi:hypothetical protein